MADPETEANGTHGTDDAGSPIKRTRSFTEELGTNLVFNVNKEQSKDAHVNSMEQYKKLYEESVKTPDIFWTKIADDFYWKEKWQGKFMDYNFDMNKGDVFVKFMEGAKTNICYNVLDRIANDKNLGDKVAFYWEGNEPENKMKITYSQLLTEVCKFSNVLKSKGMKKGDRIAIYMPMIIELVIAMLACARIGAIHSIIFAGFSADSLADRMLDGKCSMLITADGSCRGPKVIDLKTVADNALAECREKGLDIKISIVVKNVTKDTDEKVDGRSPTTKRQKLLNVPWNNDVDMWWHDVMKDAKVECECEWMDAEDPLFILYTSGSTGKPKGVLHTTGGYMLYAATTFKYTFDYHDDDVYWCTADIGWITGHSYIVYGPMANGATGVMFEGTPVYPDAGRLWEVCEKYKVTKFYTAPTAIRMLMKFGTEIVKKYDRSSLKVLGTVGEPINPEAWLWYYKVVGEEKCVIVDTFWQTETGGHMITGMPGATPMKPGSASLPFFGAVPVIVDEDGKEMTNVEVDQGFLVFKQPWPGMMRTLYNNHTRFQSSYFERFKGYYCAGDGCYRDADGFYWITGRIDDLMNVSGHLLSTAQIESALIEHSSVAETAVVGYPHPVKGNGVYCFVTVKNGVRFCDALVGELRTKVRNRIGPIANPDIIQNAPGLPKTRSGKIMRRILRKIASDDRNIGDTTTLADPNVVDELFKNKPELS